MFPVRGGMFVGMAALVEGSGTLWSRGGDSKLFHLFVISSPNERNYEGNRVQLGDGRARQLELSSGVWSDWAQGNQTWMSLEIPSGGMHITYDVRNILEFLDPLPPQPLIYTIHFTQSPLLRLLLGSPLPVRTSYVHAPFPCRFASEFTLSHIWPHDAPRSRSLGGLLSIRRLLFFSLAAISPVPSSPSSPEACLSSIPSFLPMCRPRKGRQQCLIYNISVHLVLLTESYRGEKMSFQILLSSTQAG